MSTARQIDGNSIFSTGHFDSVRFALGSAILFSFTLRTFAAFAEPVPPPFLSRFLLFALVEIELVLGVWLLAGACPQIVWWVAFVYFAGMFEVALFGTLVRRGLLFGFSGVQPLWLVPSYALAFGVVLKSKATFQSANPSQGFTKIVVVSALFSVPVVIRILLNPTADKEKMYLTRTKQDGVERQYHKELWPNEDLNDVDIFDRIRRVRRYRFLQGVACGPASLITVAARLGVQLSEEQKEHVLAAAGKRGSNLLDLQDLASEIGLHGRGVQLSCNHLRRLGLCAIVHLDGHTFAATTGYTNDGVVVAYPLEAPFVMSNDQFRKDFGDIGSALLLSTSPLPIADLGLFGIEERPLGHVGPFLRLSSNVISAGEIHSLTWEGSVTLSNDGNEVLVIEDVKPSCVCLTAELDKSKIAPSGSAVLSIKGQHDRVGSFAHSILVRSNMKSRSTVQVPVRGHIRPIMSLDKPIVTIGPIFTNDKAEIDVPLALPEMTTINDVQILIPEDAPLATMTPVSNDGSDVIRLTWSGIARPGWYRYPVELRANAPDKPQSTEVLNVVVHVLPRYESTPASLYINKHEYAKNWDRHIRILCNLQIRPDNHDAIALRWSIEEFSSAILAKVDGPVDGGSFALHISPTSNELVARLDGQRASLNVFVDGTVACSVPVHVGANSFY